MHFEIGKRAEEFQTAGSGALCQSVQAERPTRRLLWIHDWEQLVSRSNNVDDMLVAATAAPSTGILKWKQQRVLILKARRHRNLGHYKSKKPGPIVTRYLLLTGAWAAFVKNGGPGQDWGTAEFPYGK